MCLESDSKVAIKLVSEGCASSHPLSSLIQRIYKLKAKEWILCLKWCYREANYAANWFAVDALVQSSVLELHDDPPVLLKPILESDLGQSGHMRWVSMV